jgi:hypothetical protein
MVAIDPEATNRAAEAPAAQETPLFTPDYEWMDDELERLRTIVRRRMNHVLSEVCLFRCRE